MLLEVVGVAWDCLGFSGSFLEIARGFCRFFEVAGDC